MRSFAFKRARPRVILAALVGTLLTCVTSAQPNGAELSVVRDPVVGVHLAAVDGAPLFVRNGETVDHLLCTGACLDVWWPLDAGAGSVAAPDAVRADLSTFARPGGELQAAYRGRPLYLASGRADGDGVWSLANVTPVVRIERHPSLGDILVDALGMTLYTFERDPVGGYECEDACAENFPPLVVAHASQAVSDLRGALGVVRRSPEEGHAARLQVTYRGRPLYTWSRDERPGDVGGDGIAGHWEVARP